MRQLPRILHNRVFITKGIHRTLAGLAELGVFSTESLARKYVKSLRLGGFYNVSALTEVNSKIS